MNKSILGYFCALLADASPADVSDHFWKNFSLCLLVLLGVAVSVAIIYASFRKAEPVKLKDDPAIEVRKAPKRYNHDLTEIRFERIETRLDGAEAEINTTWDSVQEEKDKQAERHRENSVSLARIMERLGIKPEEKK